MTRPEIVMQTPAAKQLEIAVQRKLADFNYSTAEDVVMAEYVVVMLANAKTPDQITAELTELIGEDMYDPAFTKWLFEEVARQYGLAPAPPQSPEPQEKSLPPSQHPGAQPSEQDIGGKIETVNDSRDNSLNHRGPVKRNGNGINPMRTNQGVFNQAVGGIKRPGANDIMRDTPPHRRLRQDDFSAGSIPTGPRSDRNPRDPNWQTNMVNHAALGMLPDRRDPNNGQRVLPSFSPAGGYAVGAESAGKSILERVGMMGNPNRPFQNPSFQQPMPPFRRPNDPLSNPGSNGRPHLGASPQPMFYGSPAPYPAPGLPNNHFPQQHYNPLNASNSATPQLFLANGQPFIPSPQYHLPGSAPGVPHPAMYAHPLMHPPVDQALRPPGLHSVPLMKPPMDKPAPVATQPTEPEVGPMPTKPLLRQECKFNLACKNAWCPSSHCSPKGNPKNSMLLSFEPCEQQLQCPDSDCSKAHVSPQQKDPKSSIKPVSTQKPASASVGPASFSNARAPTYAPAVAAANGSPTPCRFGSHCTRADCVFAHPWLAKPGQGHEAVFGGEKDGKGSFAQVPCKFGLGCTRPACHFQHPSTPQAGVASHRLPSKNISKTFNKADLAGSVGLGTPAQAKLSPSKKFTPQAVTAPQEEKKKVEGEKNLSPVGGVPAVPPTAPASVVPAAAPSAVVS